MNYTYIFEIQQKRQIESELSPLATKIGTFGDPMAPLAIHWRQWRYILWRQWQKPLPLATIKWRQWHHFLSTLYLRSHWRLSAIHWHQWIHFFHWIHCHQWRSIGDIGSIGANGSPLSTMAIHCRHWRQWFIVANGANGSPLYLSTLYQLEPMIHHCR